jgi:septal ring factor EnvC (AmiA/AmiB activator)
MLTSQTETSQESETFEAAAFCDKLQTVMSPSAALISATISANTLVLAIFGASRLNQRATERLLEQLEKRFDAKFETLLTEFRPEIKRLDPRIDALDKRLDSIEARLDRTERQFDTIFKPVLPLR